MNDIDRYLDLACRSVSGPIALRKHLRIELKEHLEEAIKELVTGGMSESEATLRVLDDFGDPELVREGLQSVYGHSVTSFFVDKAMQWKEKTMKSKWTWNIAVQFGLLLIIAVAISCCVFILLWVVPVAAQWYDSVGVSFPGYICNAIDISKHMCHWWWAWLAAIVVVVGLFEWKCKSENKAMIRTTMSVGASLLSVGFAFYLTIATVIVLAMFPQVRAEHWNKPFVASKIAGAERAYRHLARAIKMREWSVARSEADEMQDNYQTLTDWDTIAVILPKETQCDGVKEISRLIRDIEMMSDEVRSAIWRRQKISVIQERFDELQKAYSQLKEKSKFFAVHTALEDDQENTEKKPVETNMAVPEPGEKTH